MHSLKIQVSKHLTRAYKKIGKGSTLHLAARLDGLLKLEKALEEKDDAEATRLALELDITDSPKIQQRPPPKQKGPSSQAPSRKPYRLYTSSGGVSILVGKVSDSELEMNLTIVFTRPNFLLILASLDARAFTSREEGGGQ